MTIEPIATGPAATWARATVCLSARQLEQAAELIASVLHFTDRPQCRFAFGARWRMYRCDLIPQGWIFRPRPSVGAASATAHSTTMSHLHNSGVVELLASWPNGAFTDVTAADLDTAMAHELTHLEAQINNGW